MPTNHRSLAALKDAVDALVLAGDLDRALRLIQEFVESIICDPFSIAKVFSAPELDDLCLRVGAATLSSLNATLVAPIAGRTAYVATEFYHHGGHTLVAGDFVASAPDQKHFFFLTDIGSNPHPDAAAARLASLGARIEAAPAGSRLEKLKWLLLRLIELAPERIFWFNHHQDSVAVAAAQSILPGQKYFVHHGDHHLSLGVHVACLRHVDLHNLGFHNCRQALHLPGNLYWPLVCPDLGGRPASVRFLGSGTLRTCSSGSANKYEPGYLYDYGAVIARMLRVTRGEHVHIGNLSDAHLDRIRRQLADNDVPQKRFVHVPWVESLWRTFIDRAIDLYLTSWPIGGGKALVEAMGAGLPLLMHLNYRSRFHSGFDLAYQGAFTWATPVELLERVAEIDSDTLAVHSRLARAHYETHHAPRVLASLLKGDGADAPTAIPLREYHSDTLQILLDEREERNSLRMAIADRDRSLAERNAQIANLNQEIRRLSQIPWPLRPVRRWLRSSKRALLRRLGLPHD